MWHVLLNVKSNIALYDDLFMLFTAKLSKHGGQMISLDEPDICFQTKRQQIQLKGKALLSITPRVSDGCKMASNP